jgi:hypothetical protein
MEFSPISDMIVMMAEMRISSKLLLVAAAVAMLLGAFVLVFAVTGWPRMAMIDAGILVMKYDPNADPEYPQSRKYAHLYHMTEVFIAERNRVAMWFLGTLGLSFLGVGGTLLAWSIDRERLRHRMTDPKPQDVR